MIDSINEAYNNKVFVVGSKNSYIGISNNGLEIEMYINNNGKNNFSFSKGVIMIERKYVEYELAKEKRYLYSM